MELILKGKTASRLFCLHGILRSIWTHKKNEFVRIKVFSSLFELNRAYSVCLSKRAEHRHAIGSEIWNDDLFSGSIKVDI